MVNGVVTISIHQYVWASSPEEAKDRALDLGMPSISNVEDFNYKPPTDEEDAGDMWRHSGELDGEPRELEVELDDPDTVDMGDEEA